MFVFVPIFLPKSHFLNTEHAYHYNLLRLAVNVCVCNMYDGDDDIHFSWPQFWEEGVDEGRDEHGTTNYFHFGFC